MGNRRRPLRVGHRGAADLAPENTLTAFRLALEHDVDAVELDLHMSQDGALVVMHDPTLRRTTGTDGEIRDYNLAELWLLDAAATYQGRDIEPQPIPTLEDVLDLVQGHAGVQIEIKQSTDNTPYPDIAAKVLDVVSQYRMLAETMILSFDFDTLHAITALEPQAQTCALAGATYLSRLGLRRRATRVATQLAAHGFRTVGLDHTYLTPQLFQALHVQGLRVGVWTVNDPQAIRKFADMGVDFVTSNRPDLLRDLMP